MKNMMILVACVNASGESDAFLAEVCVSEKQCRIGEHYDMAEQQARDAGYDGPYLCFDGAGMGNLLSAVANFKSAQPAPDRVSLLDELELADAIEIDGSFIRYFYLTTDEEEIQDGDDIMLDAEMVDENYNRLAWAFSKNDLENARFDADAGAWLVDGCRVALYSVGSVQA